MSLLIIQLLRFLFCFGFSGCTLSFFATIISFSFFIIGVLLLYKLLRSKGRLRRRNVLLYFFLSLYLFASAWKLTYYYRGEQYSITPELAAEFKTTKPNEILIQTYFKINRFPFTLESIYNARIHSFSSEIDDFTIRNCINFQRQYTYIVSYGAKIDSLTICCWDGYDILPAPWDGRIMRPKFDFDSSDACAVYIYQIPKIAIEDAP